MAFFILFPLGLHLARFHTYPKVDVLSSAGKVQEALLNWNYNGDTFLYIQYLEQFRSGLQV